MTTINKQVSTGTDDCGQKNQGIVYLDPDELLVGYDGGDDFDVGFRWQSVNIPQASTIASAKLSMYLAAQAGYMVTYIRGIAEDNTATWAIGDGPADRTSTTATKSGDEAYWSNWVVGQWTYIDITNIIQEIVNRVGWSANNALAVWIENIRSVDGNYGVLRAYEYTGNIYGAKLDVVYEARTAKLSRSTMNVHPGVMFQTLTSGHGY